jgi:hypothetical protein
VTLEVLFKVRSKGFCNPPESNLNIAIGLQSQLQKSWQSVPNAHRALVVFTIKLKVKQLAESNRHTKATHFGTRIARIVG